MTDKEKFLKILDELEAKNNCGTDDFIESKRIAYKQVRDAVNAMQEELINDDLNIASSEYEAKCYQLKLTKDGELVKSVHPAIKIAFIAGAKWQKQQDKETIELAEDHAMLAGMNKMKEEMMKDAVDAFVNTYENTDDSNYVEFVTEQSPYKFKETDKVKIVIIKED